MREGNPVELQPLALALPVKNQGRLLRGQRAPLLQDLEPAGELGEVVGPPDMQLEVAALGQEALYVALVEDPQRKLAYAVHLRRRQDP